MKKLFAIVMASFGLFACGGVEEELAESESAVYGECTTLMSAEDRAYRNYVNCTRVHRGYNASQCAGLRATWEAAWDAAEAAGCFG